jgi:SAM-dependent methyltransferase
VQDAARRTSYGDVPYVSQPFPQTHPDRLATLGRLFGLTPAPIPRCRVLELGCASGGNLIPLAYQLPESEFVGFDPSKDKPRHDFRDIYGELSGSCRGYLLDVPSGEVGGGCRGGCIITSYFQGYSLLITTSHKLGSSIFACDSEM